MDTHELTHDLFNDLLDLRIPTLSRYPCPYRPFTSGPMLDRFVLCPRQTPRFRPFRPGHTGGCHLQFVELGTQSSSVRQKAKHRDL